MADLGIITDFKLTVANGLVTKRSLSGVVIGRIAHVRKIDKGRLVRLGVGVVLHPVQVRQRVGNARMHKHRFQREDAVAATRAIHKIGVVHRRAIESNLPVIDQRLKIRRNQPGNLYLPQAARPEVKVAARSENQGAGSLTVNAIARSHRHYAITNIVGVIAAQIN